MTTPEEFAAQFKTAFRPLWLTAIGVVRDQGLAEDIVQEAAVVALRKLDQYEPETNFLAWMGQIVRFVALNRARQDKRRQTTSVEPGSLENTEAAPEGGGRVNLTDSGQLPAYQEHFDDRLAGGLGELNHVARACLLLRTVEGLDYAQISRILDIPEGTAMSHVHRARKHLRKMLATAESEREVGR